MMPGMNLEPQPRPQLNLEELASWRHELDTSDMYVTKPEVRTAFSPWLMRIRDLSLKLGRPTPDNADAFWEFSAEMGHELSLAVCPQFKFRRGACIVAAMLLGREMTE